jgi:hypothetical protein
MVATFDIRYNMYAHPDMGIFRASNKDAETAPQKDICSNNIFILHYSILYKKYVPKSKT